MTIVDIQYLIIAFIGAIVIVLVANLHYSTVKQELKQRAESQIYSSIENTAEQVIHLFHKNREPKDHGEMIERAFDYLQANSRVIVDSQTIEGPVFYPYHVASALSMLIGRLVTIDDIIPGIDEEWGQRSEAPADPPPGEFKTQDENIDWHKGLEGLETAQDNGYSLHGAIEYLKQYTNTYYMNNSGNSDEKKYYAISIFDIAAFLSVHYNEKVAAIDLVGYPEKNAALV